MLIADLCIFLPYDITAMDHFTFQLNSEKNKPHFLVLSLGLSDVNTFLVNSNILKCWQYFSVKTGTRQVPLGNKTFMLKQKHVRVFFMNHMLGSGGKLNIGQ